MQFIKEQIFKTENRWKSQTEKSPNISFYFETQAQVHKVPNVTGKQEYHLFSVS